MFNKIWRERKQKGKVTFNIFENDDFKFFTFVCLFIFSLSGLVFIVTGSFIRKSLEGFTIFAGDDYVHLSFFITIVGSLIFIFSAFTIYGVYHKLTIIVYTYVFFMFLIVSAEIACIFGGLKLITSIEAKVIYFVPS